MGINQITLQQSRKAVPLIVLAGLIFNFIFWNEELGINALIFDVFIIGSVLYLYPPAARSRIFNGLLLIHLACLAGLLLQNTVLGKFTWVMTLVLTVIFAQYVHRSVWFAGGAAMLSFAAFIPNFATAVHASTGSKRSLRGVRKVILLTAIPLVIALPFLIFYQGGNSVFENYVNAAMQSLERYFYSFFTLFEFSRLMFLLFGIYLTGALLLRSRWTILEKWEAGMSDNLKRRRAAPGIITKLRTEIVNGILGKFAKGILALKSENSVGIISLALLNLLLLVVNIIDINFLWFDFKLKPGTTLKELIHEGTEVLIFSIVMAMLVLMFFFRGNLNFYKRNRWLRYGAYAWLLQNFILVVSVAIRDYYYIREMGLAYKRIGVIIFLVLVTIGMISVLLKIVLVKTNYFLFRLNGFALVIVLTVASLIPWDVKIAEYNIRNSETTIFDISFLFELSDRALPVLDRNIDKLEKREKELANQGLFYGREYPYVRKTIEFRKKRFLEEQQKLSWLSWNAADAKAYNYFTQTIYPSHH